MNNHAKLNVLAAMADGVGFVCASCDRYWWGKARNSACQAAVVGEECGGPLAGLSFPEYKGALTGRLERFCFVCGSDPTAWASVRGVMIGVCGKHVSMIGSYSPEGTKPPFVSRRYVDVCNG